MNLLIITQKVDKDDGYFGFFHDWAAAFARHFSKVTIITLEVGAYDLPPNVTVFSLGKEAKRSRFSYVSRFYEYIWKNRRDYDVVFAHTSPLYVILGAPVWKMCGKKIALWYTHRNVDFKLRLANALSDIVFTASKEGFRLKSAKVQYMGHGIDLAKFKRPADVASRSDVHSAEKSFVEKSSAKKSFTVISVGRITPIKNLDVLIMAVARLKKEGFHLKASLVGAPLLASDHGYLESLKGLVKENSLDGEVVFAGSVPNKDLPRWYWQSDVSVNLSPTGGMDKTVLESFAAATPALVSNRAFADYFGQYTADLLVKERDPFDLADQLKRYMLKDEKIKTEIAAFLLKQVEERSSLDALVRKIAGVFQSQLNQL